MTRTWFLVLCAGVVVVAFGVGLAWGLSAGGSSSGTTPGAASPPATTSVATDAGLPSSLYTDCHAQDVPVGTGFSCTSSLAGIDEVLAIRWPSAAAMADDFAKSYASKPDGKCGTFTGSPASGYRSTWGSGKPLACYVNSNGAAIVMWEVPEKALQLLAVRKDGNSKAAFTWWNTAIKTPV